MPEKAMELIEVLEPEFIGRYLQTYQGDYTGDILYVFAKKEGGQFRSYSRSEVLWEDKATRDAEGDYCYGMDEVGSVEELVRMLVITEGNPDLVLQFINGGNSVSRSNSQGNVDVQS